MPMPSDFWLQLTPLIIWSVIVAITGCKLAVEKERNVVLWVVLGLLPFVNFACLAYFVGATNLRLERKIDELSSRLDGRA